MALSPQIEAAIERVARERGIDPAALRAFVRIESGGRPDVTTGSYKGLLQLSEQQFREHGGQGSVYDPEANLSAGAGKLAAMTQRFQQRYGRAPTSSELYLMHQQGEGGAAAHMANPDAPAWQNMASTAEGRAKGPDWAKRAIWGNVPDDVKARYGSVDNLTSRDFQQLWADKVGRFSGATQMASASPVAPVSPSSATPAPQQGEKPVFDVLASLFGKMAGPAQAGATMASGPTLGPMPMGGGNEHAKLAEQGMKSVAMPESSILGGPSQMQRQPDLQQLMAVLSNRQKLGLGRA